MMSLRFGLILLTLVSGWFSVTRPVRGQLDSIDFTTHILPILNRHCVDCHGPDEHESALRLHSMRDALRGGDSGETVITPGDSRRSHLIQRVTSPSVNLRMPPAGQEPLSPSEIELLQRWIDDEPSWKAAREALTHQTIDHWSFQPITRPSVPDTDQPHPVDAFIQSRLQREGISLSPAAGRRTLIRRLYLVMLGLPPTPAEVAAFEQDARPDAWERLVDRTLSSPHYGERWAMHWLDLIRFGETNGFETNRERPHAYPFRDWVISSLNQDKPYNDFVREQIAGDQLGQPIATGFLVSGPNDIVKGQDELLGLMQRQDELSDIVNTVGTAFLGLTTGCARCHNHKFDPITQTDFYALQAVFAGVQHGDQSLPLTEQQSRQIAELDKSIAERQQQLARLLGVSALREPVAARENVESFEPRSVRFVRFYVDQTNASEPCIDELQVFEGDKNVALASAGARTTSSGDFVHPLHKLEHLNDGRFGNSHSWIAAKRADAWVQIELPAVHSIDRIVWGRDREGQFADRIAIRYRIEASADGSEWITLASSANRRPFVAGQTAEFDLSLVKEESRAEAQATLNSLKDLEARRKSLAENNKAYCGTFSPTPEVKRLFRGDPTAPREVVSPGSISSLGSIEANKETPEAQRRLRLADWIVHADHPLTARVMANRLWQFHFGIGIVDTPSDFGANGAAPTHPELLDWLADTLRSNDWSLKRMHRLLLTSNTWQQSSAPRETGLAVDAQSRLLWRYPPRRLEAEPIRDCILATAGQLDSAMGGPGFSAFEVELENVRHYFPKKDYGPADWRRMVYMTKVRQEKDSVFGVFDCPDASQVTPKRSRSTTPLQALNLLNSRFVLQQSELMAKRLKRERSSTIDQVQLAYQLTFNRDASPDEVRTAGEFIEEHGLIPFTRALLNTNEFVFIP